MVAFGVRFEVLALAFPLPFPVLFWVRREAEEKGFSRFATAEFWFVFGFFFLSPLYISAFHLLFCSGGGAAVFCSEIVCWSRDVGFIRTQPALTSDPAIHVLPVQVGTSSSKIRIWPCAVLSKVLLFSRYSAWKVLSAFVPSTFVPSTLGGRGMMTVRHTLAKESLRIVRDIVITGSFLPWSC